MRLALLAVLAVAGAALARAQGGSEFPQTQSQPSYSGSGSDAGNSWQSDQSQTGPRAARGPGAAPPGMPGRSDRGVVKRPKRAVTRGDEPPGGPQNADRPDDGSREDRQVDDRSGRDGAVGDAAAGSPRPIDLDGARENFAALVESYVAKRSAKGYWSYVAKKGAKARHLIEPKVDEDSVARTRGPRFSARVSLKDLRGGKPAALEFEADFSGSDWRIVAVRPAAVSSRR